MTTVHAASDMDAASEMLSAQYTWMRLSARGPRQGLRVAQDQLGPIRLDRVTARMDFDATGAPVGAVYIGHVLDGRVSYGNVRHESAYLPGDVFFAVEPDEPLIARVRNVDCEWAVLPLGLLNDIADTEPGRTQRVQLSGPTLLSTAAARMWVRSYNYARTVAATELSAEQRTLMFGSAARLLAATALALFPHTALLDPTIEDRHDAHLDTLRRAIAFIEADPQHDITVAAIAAAACVTIRAVQLAFRRHLDTTPMAYLRRVRLHHAHRDLVQATPATSSVTAIAARWGFTYPSRFAALYRREFGERPSHTLEH